MRRRDIIVGDPDDAASFMGAICSKQHLDKIRSYMDIAREDGGTIVVGGNVPVVKGCVPLAARRPAH